MHLVYELWNPFTIECFYVGKTNSKKEHIRFREHLNDAKKLAKGDDVQNHLKCGTIRKIIDMGAIPFYLIVAKFETEKEALEEEKRLVAHYGRRLIGIGPLTNLTEGGEGSSGRVLSRATLQKMSEAKKGIPLSDARRAQLDINRKKKKQFGRPAGTFTMSDSAKKKISEARTGKTYSPLSDEHKANLSEALRGKNVGKKRSEEAKMKMRIAARGRTLSVEHRQKISEARKGKTTWNAGKKLGPLSDEVKLKISLAKKKKSQGEV